ncbi:MAG: acyl-CoA dehydrogenase family protein [Dehalococcoidia bacterium]|nr:acyl-CoA dehydrogenase family protein [Dehalococcoidia bacterium]
MDFRDTPEETAFRQEVREFIAREAPKQEGTGDRDIISSYAQVFVQSQQWFKKLSERGWIAPAWPKEYGGAGMTVMQQFIFNEEMAEARATRPLHLIIGVAMAGPTLIVHGNEEQKKYHLPRIISGEDIWCQGFSEPEAGSDLASLRTRAVREGDDYVINGQKIWTTIAHLSKWMLLLARTDPDAPKHRGITYFILDMKSPGVDVRPLVNMAGGYEFSEVFFTNVRVPKANIIGEENRGWYAAMSTLDFERSAIGSAIGLRQTVEDIILYAKEHTNDGTSMLCANPMLRYELVDRLLETEVGRMLSYRVVSLQSKGLIPNYEAAVVKLYNMELDQRIARTGMTVLGPYGQLDRGSKWAPLRGRLEYMYLRAVGSTLETGTSEIQRNIVATRGLGLPRGD